MWCPSMVSSGFLTSGFKYCSYFGLRSPKMFQIPVRWFNFHTTIYIATWHNWLIHIWIKIAKAPALTRKKVFLRYQCNEHHWRNESYFLVLYNSNPQLADNGDATLMKREKFKLVLHLSRCWHHHTLTRFENKSRTSSRVIFVLKTD